MGRDIGNCIFVLITGYLLYNKKFTLKRIIKLWLDVWSYSIGIGIICYCLLTTGGTPVEVIKEYIETQGQKDLKRGETYGKQSI